MSSFSKLLAFTCNTAMTNFADENLVAIFENFRKEKSDKNYFIFNRAFHDPWMGLWSMEMEGDDGQYIRAHLYFYKSATELKGTIMFENKQPAQVEIMELKESKIKFLAILPSHTATVELGLADGKLSGKSYYDKPLTHLLKKELRLDQELRRMFEPRVIRNGKKMN